MYYMWSPERVPHSVVSQDIQLAVFLSDEDEGVEDEVKLSCSGHTALSPGVLVCPSEGV